MQIMTGKTVLDAAIERINMLFDKFEDIYVYTSGGKDSTVVFDLTRKIALERGRKIGVYFLDQEFEWQATIDVVKRQMQEEGVIPFWYQVPLKMYNASSNIEPFVHIWDESRKDKWMRPHDELAITEKYADTDRFHPSLDAFLPYRKRQTGLTTCGIGGVRANESLSRIRATTVGETVDGITWGKKAKDETYSFYPIYDWNYTDVWKYINDNGLYYNAIYDRMYQLGTNITNMRISNLIHEFTLANTDDIQILEAETYNKMLNALEGVSCTSHFGEDFMPDELPDVFMSWKEYRDYLLEALIDPQYRDGFRKVWEKQPHQNEIYYRYNVIEVLRADVTHTVHKDLTLVNGARRMRTDAEKKKRGMKP